jgi:hypothetical protein
MRPAALCQGLLAALEAAEGRRRRRERDTRPDAIGLAVKRRLLADAVAADPDPAEFEAWLLRHCRAAPEASPGAIRAMAMEVWAEWRLAARAPAFQAWLEAGAPSDDRAPAEPG